MTAPSEDARLFEPAPEQIPGQTMMEGTEMSEDTTYNGWKNYETWAVGMFLDGNYDGQVMYAAALDVVGEAVDESEERDKQIYEASDALKTFVEIELQGEDGDRIVGLAGDLLGAALSEVDWRELATHKVDEVLEGRAQ